MAKSSSILHPAVFIPTLKQWVVRRAPPFVVPHLREVKYFLKFSVVGVTGFIVDFGSLTILHELLDFPLLPSVATAFCAAVVNNYVWNILWTYSHQDHSNHHHKTLSKFAVVSLVGLLVNLSIVHVMSNILGIFWLFSKITATAIVLFWNFAANRLWTFRE